MLDGQIGILEIFVEAASQIERRCEKLDRMFCVPLKRERPGQPPKTTDHGSRYQYRVKGCRCGECRTWNANRARKTGAVARGPFQREACQTC